MIYLHKVKYSYYYNKLFNIHQVNNYCYYLLISQNICLSHLYNNQKQNKMYIYQNYIF